MLISMEGSKQALQPYAERGFSTFCTKSTEYRLDDNENQCRTADLYKDRYVFGASDLSTSNQCTPDETVTAMDISTSFKSTQQLLKFVFLLGILTVQGAEKASATSNIMDNLQSANFFGDLSDISTGFASAFLLIFFSELGDKTFFIAALLAARNSATVVFAGTFGALAIMTIISVVLGRTFHYIDGVLPVSFAGSDLPIDDIAAVCLLVYFGVTTLVDATSSDSQKAEDEQKEAELAVSEFSGNGSGILAAASTIASTFALVFVAEWGDKSFFSTIALAAASSPLGVVGGAFAGHGVATLLAVAGGSLLGSFLSEKVISYVGGVLFLLFACITLIEIIQG
ncbi:protein PAM71, chloroplastic isoform X3 [Beta vulgaris subsp. vulgaris]|uniref:protein PAM71, chloroplastic isoform X3 n=1 Tax=Beta vulgaris subsp. vulgaris TaxID=3555 RepID=UPI00053F2B51|nr:protein PAM71, chloroplastic isoform X3 [Beta vulgaris subsp. vulgaris]